MHIHDEFGDRREALGAMRIDALQRDSSEHSAGAAKHVRSLTLGWTDPDTGDRLTAQVGGGEALLPELERQGFQLLSFDVPERQSAEPGPSAMTVISELAESPRRYVSRRN